MKTIFLSVLGVLGLCLLAIPTQAQWGVGLNYPGWQVRYLGEKIALDLKGEFGRDQQCYGPRLTYYFAREKMTKGEITFSGIIEGDYVFSNGEEGESTGWLVYAAPGLECFLCPNFSVGVDMGPAYINLKDKGTEIEEAGVEWVANINLIYYFGGDGR